MKKLPIPDGGGAMALTIKGIEAAKPKLDKASGKYKLVCLADGNGLFLEVTEKSKHFPTNGLIRNA